MAYERRISELEEGMANLQAINTSLLSRHEEFEEKLRVQEQQYREEVSQTIAEAERRKHALVQTANSEILEHARTASSAINTSRERCTQWARYSREIMAERNAAIER